MQLIGALALALLVLASISTDTSLANKRIVETGPELSVSGGVFPSLLPRVKPVPVTVKVGFTIEGGGSPELDWIALEISRTVTFQTSGLPSCQLAMLYSTAPSARRICAGSLVGHGRVVSRVTLPGREPTTINGSLLAFYTTAEGRPGILAVVKSQGALPLTYVIPFQFGRQGQLRHESVCQQIADAPYPWCLRAPKCLFRIDLRFRGDLRPYFEVRTLPAPPLRQRREKRELRKCRCPVRGRQLSASFVGANVQYTGSSYIGSASADLLSKCRVTG